MMFDVDYIKYATMFFVNQETGEKEPVMELTDADFDITPTDEDKRRTINLLNTRSFTGTFTCDGIFDTMKKVQKQIDEYNKTKKVLITYGLVQRRKNKNGRINKKWQKKYGFKSVINMYPICLATDDGIHTRYNIPLCKLNNVKYAYIVDEDKIKIDQPFFGIQLMPFDGDFTPFDKFSVTQKFDSHGYQNATENMIITLQE